MLQTTEVAHFIRCGVGCHELDHMAVFTYTPGDDLAYLHYWLMPERPWYRRLWCAIRYLCGRVGRGGQFGETILTRETAAVLAMELMRFAGGATTATPASWSVSTITMDGAKTDIKTEDK